MMRRYMRPAELATEFGVSTDYVRDIIRCIRVNMKSQTRYSALDLIGSGKVISLRTAAYMDCARYRQYINTDMEQYIPIYDPLETEYELGLAERDIDIDKLAGKVWEAIKTKLAII